MKKNKKEDRVKKFNKIWVATYFAFGMNFTYGYEIVVDETVNENEISFVMNYDNGVPIDGKTKLMWQDDISAKSTEKNWQDAIHHCQNLEIGVYSDWRLPSRMELFSIVDRSKKEPAIIGVFKNVASGYYWSSSTRADDSNNAWGVYFGNGNGYTRNKGDNRLVRCVRDSK